MEPIKQEGWVKQRDYQAEMIASSRTVDYRSALYAFKSGADWARRSFVQPLEKQVDELKEDLINCSSAAEDAIYELRAENTRLREALQFIAKDDDWQVYDAVDEDFKLMRQMVKAALNPKPL
jgi:hypothetical protein